MVHMEEEKDQMWSQMLNLSESSHGWWIRIFPWIGGQRMEEAQCCEPATDDDEGNWKSQERMRYLLFPGSARGVSRAGR